MVRRSPTAEPAEPAGLRGRRVADALIREPKLLAAGATIADVRTLFADDHVHVALLVEGGELVTVVERSDLVEAGTGDAPARHLGRLDGRVAHPDDDLLATWRTMTERGQRRLAVVDREGTLVGLLCLKRSSLGFCSEADVAERSAG